VPVFEGDADGQVRERVVRARLVGHDIDLQLTRAVTQEQFPEHQGGIPDHAHGQRLACGLRRDDPCDRLVEVGAVLVEVPVFDSPAQPRLVHVDDQHGTSVHRHGQRLGAAHAAAAPGQGDRAGQRRTARIDGLSERPAG